MVNALVAEHNAHGDPLQAAAAFGDDVGDLPAFAALVALRHLGGPLQTVVRVAAVDPESPAAVADAADLTVAGATGAVALLRTLATPPLPRLPVRLSVERPPAGRPTSRPACGARTAARRGCAPRAPLRRAPWSGPRAAASAVPATSKGLMPSAPLPSSASSAQAPAWWDSTSTPSRHVEQRAFLGDEVEAVTHRVDEQHVGQRQHGERAGPVVLTRSTMGVQPSVAGRRG